MDTLTMPQSTPMYVPSTVSSAEEWWTSLRRDFPASPTPLQESNEAQRTKGISGLIPSESLAKWDPQSFSWRTSQVSLPLDGMVTSPTQEPLSGSWPQQGMTLFGVCFQRPVLERPMLGRGGGAWPTPTATERANQDGEVTASERSWEKFRAGEIKRIRKTRAPTLTTALGGPPNPDWTEWLMGLPIEWSGLKPLETESYRAWWLSFSEE